MITLKLNRKKYTDKQTISTIDVYRFNDFICSFASLELKWNNNEISKSCIPKGIYQVKRWNSQSHPDTFILEKTEPRTSILIHSGNYFSHTEGCILIGLTHEDINNDGYIDLIDSKKAIDKLNKICENEKVITIEIN